jgi:MbtH protein
VTDAAQQFLVVVNDEEQYSIWPVGRALPDGWCETGFAGPEDEALAEIGRVWTDITPKSARLR